MYGASAHHEQLCSWGMAIFCDLGSIQAAKFAVRQPKREPLAITKSKFRQIENQNSRKLVKKNHLVPKLNLNGQGLGYQISFQYFHHY